MWKYTLKSRKQDFKSAFAKNKTRVLSLAIRAFILLFGVCRNIPCFILDVKLDLFVGFDDVFEHFFNGIFFVFQPYVFVFGERLFHFNVR